MSDLALADCEEDYIYTGLKSGSAVMPLKPSPVVRL
jgi:hypothetical protein